MSARVDAAGEARDHDEASFAEIARQAFREAQAERGGVARSDDRDHRTLQHRGIAAQPDQRRRILGGSQHLGIAGLAHADIDNAEPRPAAANSASASSTLQICNERPRSRCRRGKAASAAAPLHIG